jgi:hypothetical protein
MLARLTFPAICVFWVVMNALLWRAEYGSRGDDAPVPVELVWRKILTAPDASSLSVFQNRTRMGYCEFSTGIGQQMALVEGDRPPPDSLAKTAGYQLHLAGNVAFGDFTNRFKFDARAQFSAAGQWRELNLKIIARAAMVEIHSVATNRSVHVRLVADGESVERDLTFADLQNPAAVIRAFAGNSADGLLDAVELPDFAPLAAQKPEWRATRTRVKIGSESVPIYRLETGALGQNVTMDVSTLGEVLRLQLPGNYSASIDEWAKP